MVIYRRADGYIEAVVGPVLSYYEFSWPMPNRLTDEAWRKTLSGDETPERPLWAAEYMKNP
ncbi:MAG: DUF3160 domain-containing protein [Candidatus Aegiribacteria sp.]|nr:DUF3160 domain-containing protein [Candidatus Aegiribacteria sp.]